jgi:chromosomal replication initiator protein
MQQVFDFPLRPAFTFDNFVVCAGNQAAFHFARQLASTDCSDNLLYIYGATGSGKTHLLSAIGAACCPKTAGSTVTLLSVKDLDEIYHGEFPSEAVSKLAERFRHAPLLLIDDIHLIPDNANFRIELWQLFNDFHGSGKKIAVTGLHPPRELPHLDGHLVSRLLWGLVAQVDVSDDESRRMILKKLARDRHILIPDEVIDYFVQHAQRDIPSLVEALEWTSRLALSTKRKITLRLVREALR